MRDITLEDTIYIEFSTRAFTTGIPTTLAGTPVVSWSENGGANDATGVTLSVDLNTVTGNHLLTIVATAANGFENGKDYNLKITTGTVGGVSVIGEKVGSFTNIPTRLLGNSCADFLFSKPEGRKRFLNFFYITAINIYMI